MFLVHTFTLFFYHSFTYLLLFKSQMRRVELPMENCAVRWGKRTEEALGLPFQSFTISCG